MDRRQFLVGSMSVGAGSVLALPFSAASTLGTRAGRALQRHISKRFVDDLSGIRSGTVSLAQAQLNVRVVNDALGQGGVLRIRPGMELVLAGELLVRSGNQLVSDGSGSRPILRMDTRWFDNSLPRPSRDQPRSGLFRVPNGVSDVNFENFAIAGGGQQGRALVAMRWIDCSNIKAAGLEIAELPSGFGFQLTSVRGGSTIADCIIRDFFDNSLDWSRRVQSTGIAIDDDRVGAPSAGLIITNNTIKSIRQGPGLASLPQQGGKHGLATGQQTDGINIQHFDSVDHKIIDNTIDGVGEAIDCFGSSCTIEGNRLRNSDLHGLKFVHGAQNNVARNNVIENAGRIGIVFNADYGPGRRAVTHNQVIGGSISGIGFNKMWSAYGTTAAIRFECRPLGPLVFNPADNLVDGVTLSLDQRCSIGWQADAIGDADLNNQGRNLHIVGRPARARVLISKGRTGIRAGFVQLAGETGHLTDLK